MQEGKTVKVIADAKYFYRVRAFRIEEMGAGGKRMSKRDAAVAGELDKKGYKLIVTDSGKLIVSKRRDGHVRKLQMPGVQCCAGSG